MGATVRVLSGRKVVSASVPSCDRNPAAVRNHGLTGEDVAHLVRNTVRVPVKDRFKITPLCRGRVCRQFACELRTPLSVYVGVAGDQPRIPEEHEPGDENDAARSGPLHDTHGHEDHPSKQRPPARPHGNDRDQPADTDQSADPAGARKPPISRSTVPAG
jgi:hypothetical protein